MQITNNSGISLTLAVWLVNDDYDYINTPNYISATRLMKPIRQIVLAKRVPPEMRQIDVEDRIATALGTALHDSIEKAWVKNYKSNLKQLGYPESVINRVLINPTDEELAAVDDPIPVYLEQRATRELNGYTIGGKFDLVADGMVQDNKSTSAYTWVHGGRDEEHQLQGSIYRWLNPKKITEDFIRINYIFTDWQKSSAKSNPKYPQKRVEHKDIPLLTEKETEKWISTRIRLIETYMDAEESQIPECTDKELWRSEPAYKYYSDPTKTSGRSTKNFDKLSDAKAFMSEKGNKGIVITVPGEPKRCGYCDVAEICSQRKRYFPDD